MYITLIHKVSRQLLQQRQVLETFDGTETESLCCQYIIIQEKAFTPVWLFPVTTIHHSALYLHKDLLPHTPSSVDDHEVTS